MKTFLPPMAFALTLASSNGTKFRLNVVRIVIEPSELTRHVCLPPICGACVPT